MPLSFHHYIPLASIDEELTLAQEIKNEEITEP